jgi:hypothetical protein
MSSMRSGSLPPLSLFTHLHLQLIGGATETLKKKLRLKALKNYRYLNMSSEVDVCHPTPPPSLSLTLSSISMYLPPTD